MFRKSPGFALLAILLLAIGIGANTAIFSVVEAVMLRPLPYRDPGKICMVWKCVPAKGLEWDWTSEPMIRDWRERSHVFEEVALILRPEGSRVTVSGGLGAGAAPENIQASKVSANLFPLFGVDPILGRAFSEEEARRGENLAILSYGFWRGRFAGSPDVLGRNVEIDHRAATIIGVMPSGFQFPDKDTQMWLSITADQRWPIFQVKRVADAFSAVARLKQHVSLEQARADIASVEAGLATEYPATDAGLGVRIVPLPEQVAGPRVRQSLWVLLGAVLLVLMITCSNVASLMLARGAARQRELAIRAALGAGRGRLLRQLLTETLGLCGAGGLAGILLAYIATPALVNAAPSELPRLDQVRIDSGVLGFATLLSMAAGLVFGLVPAWQAARRDPREMLQDGGRGSSAGAAVGKTRGFLVAAEYAIAVMLLAGAGLLVHSFLVLQAVNLGFDQHRLLLMNLSLPDEKYGDPARSAAFFEQAIERVEAIPGVQGAAVGELFSQHSPNTRITVEGRPAAEVAEPNGRHYVTAEYFRVLGIPILQGRLFSPADGPNSPAVAIINEAMAGRFWPGESPLGKRFKQTLPGLDAGWFIVVGVAADVVSNGRESAIIPMFYRPLRQTAWSEMGLVVRTASDPLTLAPIIRLTVLSMDPAVPYFEVTTADHQLGELEAGRRFETGLLLVFAAGALLLAAAGVYGTLYYAVEQRTKEIGIRVALGADKRRVVGLVLGQGLRWVALGLGIGMAGAFALTRLISGLLYGIEGTDPWAIASALGVLLAVALVAASVPARRAARLDPLISIRHE